MDERHNLVFFISQATFFERLFGPVDPEIGEQCKFFVPQLDIIGNFGYALYFNYEQLCEINGILFFDFLSIFACNFKYQHTQK